MTHFEIGNYITPTKPVKGLKVGCVYKIVGIRRGIDGAYDWDDLTLYSIKGNFCEFDFALSKSKDEVTI